MKIWQSDKKIIKFLRISWKSIIIDSFIDTAVTKETAKRGWFLEVYLKCVKMCQILMFLRHFWDISEIIDKTETSLKHFWDYWQKLRIVALFCLSICGFDEQWSIKPGYSVVLYIN